MASDGQIIFEITADNRDAISEIRETTRVIRQETQQWEQASDDATGEIEGGFTSTLKKIGAAFAAAKIGQKLLDIGKEAISLASDLDEVQNVVDVTFGSSGAAKIESWAKAAGSQFGLTEIQAKRFTSTLGAMMKSSGIAGDEIVEMSTNLSGLAADMASFYNLDFDEAFQKIRSGISGETEPLKQLGINMSVANLNAYALKQGLSKTFEQMTQGEQTMLRYQYMMEATSDAQGDFARTSDGYANSVRTLETNIETLKTKLGTPLLEAVNGAIGAINQLFPEGGTRYSVFDELNDIDLDLTAKTAAIEATKRIADNLTDTLAELTTYSVSEDINTIAGKAGTAASGIEAIGNNLRKVSSTSISAVRNAVTGINANSAGAKKAIEDVGNALSNVKLSSDAKALFYGTFTTFTNNVNELAKIKGDDAQGVSDFLDKIQQSAEKLAPENTEGWAALLGALTNGFPEIFNTEGGQDLASKLTELYLSLGSESAVAVQGLTNLGYSTEEITQKQNSWLAICQQLVKNIPGLSEIIDTNTGDVKGGITAVQQYTDQWERLSKTQATIAALQQKKSIIEEKWDIEKLKNDALSYQMIMEAILEAGGYEAESHGTDRLGYMGIANHFIAMMKKEKMTFDEVTKTQGANVSKFKNMTEAEQQAIRDYAESIVALQEAEMYLPVAQQKLDDQMKQLAEDEGKTVEEMNALIAASGQAEKEMSTLAKAANDDAAAMEEVQNAVNGANEALKNMADYAENVHTAVANSINSVADGLKRVDYQTYGKQIEKISELTEKQSKYKVGSDEWKKLQTEIDNANKSLVSTNSIYSNLESQAQFLDDYLANLKKAREMGLSDALLAELSDGSVESAQYLDALVNDKTGKTAAEIDQKYQEIQEKKAALTEELASQQLTVDQTYQALAEKAKEAVAALDLGEEAKDNAAATIQGIADGIGEKNSEVAEAVNGIIEQLNRLNGYGIDLDFGGFGHITFTTSVGKAEGSGLMGIPLVPHDDYIARLHEGERVLTAQENQIWNALRNGGVSGFDLETLGGVMRDNVHAGGNVYLDGRVVGSVISDQQGRSYRQLQRSGWQS